jgi:hypothetical protein
MVIVAFYAIFKWPPKFVALNTLSMVEPGVLFYFLTWDSSDKISISKKKFNETNRRD